jgi:hypothetical protein
MTYSKMLIAALLTIIAAPAYALDCMPRADAYEQLEDKGYEPVFIGDAEAATMVVWVHQTEGWITIVDTHDGQSCMVAAGLDWQFRALGDPV